MKSNQLVILFVLLASCNSQTNQKENIAQKIQESAVNSTRKAPVISPSVVVVNPKPSVSEAISQKALDLSKVPGANIAIAFMNSYVDFCNERGTNDIEWVGKNQYVTNSFKAEHKSLLEEARKDDPELGLGFDPILDAQDIPEKGVKLIEFDKEGYMTLQGIDWSEYTVVVKVKKEGNEWLVDGAGVLNVPESRRATR